MSIIFGICKTENEMADEEQLASLASQTDRHATDGSFIRVDGWVGMGFQPRRTHERSYLEVQPVVDAQGNMLTFNGRLDNHEELCTDLDIEDREAPDSLIVLAAFDRWGEGCFSRLIGDWALALWSCRDRSLYLARDHAGTRTLYYERTEGQILWSTYLETFLAADKTYRLNENYAISYLAGRPMGDLTPYDGIRAIPAAHYLVFRGDYVAQHLHWNWMSKAKVRYAKDSEYEEHFFELFRQAVERRIVTGAPILAQLSGGMDSSAIVCVSDLIRRESSQDLLDTVSYYDDSEPNWDEARYFSIVERQRGKSGIHIKTSFTERTFEAPDIRSPLPGFDSSSVERERRLRISFEGRDYQTILSGLGGDELLGGIPTPLPELADDLAAARLKDFISRATEWCLASRTPVLHMVTKVLAEVAKLYGTSASDVQVRRLSRRERMQFSPATLYGDQTWWAVIEKLPHLHPESLHRYEYRYPYLDRDLAEFLLSIPRNQLVSPHQRRSLMRRSLRSIVPEEVLTRRRKGYVIRAPLLCLRERQPRIEELFAHSLIEKAGLIDGASLRALANKIFCNDNTAPWPKLLRAISLELWMRDTPSLNFCSHQRLG